MAACYPALRQRDRYALFSRLTEEHAHEICIHRELGNSVDRFNPEPFCTHTSQLSSYSILKSLHDFTLHTSRRWVKACRIQSLCREDRDFVSDDVPLAIGVNKFALHPPGKTTVNESHDLDRNVLHETKTITNCPGFLTCLGSRVLVEVWPARFRDGFHLSTIAAYQDLLDFRENDMLRAESACGLACRTEQFCREQGADEKALRAGSARATNSVIGPAGGGTPSPSKAPMIRSK